MRPIEYFARHYSRHVDSGTPRSDDDLKDNTHTMRAFIAGAQRVLTELEALEVPIPAEFRELMEEQGPTAHECTAHFVVQPYEPHVIIPAALSVQFGDGQEEPLGPCPCPRSYRAQMLNESMKTPTPALYDLAFRMVQEIHGKSPEAVLALGPMLAKYLQAHYDPTTVCRIPFTEVIEFCDIQISRGNVPTVPHRLFESEEELEELERDEVTTPTLLGLEYLTQGYDARMSDMDIERLVDEEMERLQREGDDEQGILF